MNAIHVPAPSKDAFNKDRRVSDLIRAQVNHFKHLEYKLPAELKQGIPQHAIVSENDAAKYILAMTRFLKTRSAGAAGVASAAAALGTIKAKTKTAIAPTEGLALAASAERETGGKSVKGKRAGSGKGQKRMPKFSGPSGTGKI
jgi:hypothetical protein